MGKGKLQDSWVWQPILAVKYANSASGTEYHGWYSTCRLVADFDATLVDTNHWYPFVTIDYVYP